MSSPLAALEPRSVWSHFDTIRAIPRPSKQEGRIVEHIRGWASAHGFTVRNDSVGNLCVAVPASKGHEAAPTVVLQGHLDMVAEKDGATEFDFSKDAIHVVVDGDWVVAPHTTLGADNGIGVAAAMASADDPSVVHGPLELLFTVDEETGLTGALGLDPSLVTGRTLLNLDSEEEGTLFVGCAGGCTTHASLPLARAALEPGWVALRVEVRGLRGGHSGLAIHENRGNALKVMARVLGAVSEGCSLRIDTLHGGNKHNAIPRETDAVIAVPEGEAARVFEAAARIRERMLTEIGGIDPGLTIEVRKADLPDAPADAESSWRLVRLLLALPHGVIAMSRDIPGLTETSTNLAIVDTSHTSATITTSTRSSVAAALRFTLDQARAAFVLAGATTEETSSYPGWQPNMSSPLLGTSKRIFREVFPGEPKITAIHAGLECGLLGEKLPGIDMISFGPWIEGPHAPGERVNIPSVATFWQFHKALLRALC